jgi:hypothetical protein
MPVPTPDTLATVLRHVDASLEASRGRLFDLLRIPSISAQPDHRQDCLRAAGWVCDQLALLGFRAAARPTTGHPVVVAHHAGPAGYQGPHILSIRSSSGTVRRSSRNWSMARTASASLRGVPWTTRARR